MRSIVSIYCLLYDLSIHKLCAITFPKTSFASSLYFDVLLISLSLQTTNAMRISFRALTVANVSVRLISAMEAATAGDLDLQCLFVLTVH